MKKIAITGFTEYRDRLLMRPVETQVSVSCYPFVAKNVSQQVSRFMTQFGITRTGAIERLIKDDPIQAPVH
jgi:hypothetical protein